MAERPHVRIEPAVRFGQPTVAGISTDAIAGRIWAGDSVTETADDFGLSRGQVLVACWHEGYHGQPHSSYRKAWRHWADEAGQHVWDGGDWNQIPDPPSREEVTS